ncbi:hypothetical protein OG21DRAFT_532232 [Imleria badia]|nr:hypothetical protein OG21DRAFT_532232 [Imleria badia]
MEVILIFRVNKSGEFYGYARMTSSISHGKRSVSWASRADSSHSTPSPSTSRLPTHGKPEQWESSPRQSPEMYTSPFERRFVETSPSPLAPSSGETKECPTGASSSQAQERRSAPPMLDHDSEDPVSPDPLPAFSSSPPSDRDDPSESDPPSDADPPATLRPELGKYPGVGAVARSRGGGGIDDPGSLGWRLLPVVEEVHTERVSKKPDQHRSIPSDTTFA